MHSSNPPSLGMCRRGGHFISADRLRRLCRRNSCRPATKGSSTACTVWRLKCWSGDWGRSCSMARGSARRQHHRPRPLATGGKKISRPVRSWLGSPGQGRAHALARRTGGDQRSGAEEIRRPSREYPPRGAAQSLSREMVGDDVPALAQIKAMRGKSVAPGVEVQLRAVRRPGLGLSATPSTRRPKPREAVRGP